MLRGAIVGLGQVALKGHLPAWKGRPDSEIIAGVDSSPERTALFQKDLPQAAVFSSLEDCLKNTKLDFVDIAVPPHIHFLLIQTALRAGLHVLCEKPLVLTKSELAQLVSEREKSGKILMTVHNWKFAAICRKLSELVRSKRIGDVTRVEWYVLRNGPAVTTLSEKENWRLNPKMSGGGILIDHGWHAFYLLLDWLERFPKTVQAHLENRQYEDLPVEDTAKVGIEFDGSPRTIAEVFLTWASRVRKNSGLVEGTQGRIRMEDDRLILDLPGKEPEAFQFESALSAGSHHPDWFGAVADEFFSEILDPKIAGRNFKIAQTCFDLIEKSKESSEKRVPIFF